ncbi:MAG TPA: hypothetical protein PKM41_11880 [Deltaproteobacteria bacterium]|jgi:hypothetical protein|nr:hypothetical protein [Deltaproteobacteria bacterium]HOI07821.1 hypothetical protein [Deltaproteobacteria bacterium]
MPDSTVLIIIAAAVGCGVAAAIGYYVVRRMKGSITLHLPRTAFNPGDTITGSFDVLTRKPVKGNRLTVSLIGVQTTTARRDGRAQTQSREIYRDERVLEEAREYGAGHTARHGFELPIPNMKAPEFMNSEVFQMLAAAMTLLGSSDARITWRVEARLDAQGVDLASSTQVTVNMY